MAKEEGLKINQETMDVLVTNVIPTTKYFESRFDHMQYQITEIKDNQKSMMVTIDKRFEDVQYQINEIKDNQKSMMVNINKKFEKIDKKFEDMQSKNDERFKQIDERLSSIDLKIEQLITSQQTSVRDYIIERDRFYDKKFNNLRMLNIATISIVAGIFLKMTGVITI